MKTDRYSATLERFFSDLCKGVLETGDSFKLSDQEGYDTSSVTASVGASSNSSMQTVPMHATLLDVLEFGKYLEFHLSKLDTESGNPATNAFNILTTRKKYWPSRKVAVPGPGSLLNNKETLRNDFIDWLQERDWGWSDPQSTLANSFVREITEVLWLIDCHRDSLEKRSCNIHPLFNPFQGYNRPQMYKRKPKPLSAEQLRTHTEILFQHIEQVSNKPVT